MFNLQEKPSLYIVCPILITLKITVFKSGLYMYYMMLEMDDKKVLLQKDNAKLTENLRKRSQFFN